MEITQIFDASHHAACSPDGAYIASLTAQNLYIQHAATLTPAFTYPLPPTQRIAPDSTLQWSASSSHVILLTPTGVHVFTLSNLDAKIQLSNGSGSLGRIIAVDLLAAETNPQLLVLWEFGRIGIWDLTSGRATELGDAKTGGRGNPWAVRRGQGQVETLALLMRHNGQDMLGLYSPPSTVPFRTTPLGTADALSLAWSPDGRWLGVFDSFLGTQQCHVYTADGFLFRQLPTAPTPTTDLHKSEANAGLGYKAMAWSKPHVVLSETQSLTLLNTRTFSKAGTITLASVKTEVTSLEDGVEAYQEVINAANQRSYTTLTGQLIPVPTPKSSIIDIQPDSTGAYLTSRDAGSAGTLYVFDVERQRVHSILLQNSPIRKANWHPSRKHLMHILAEDGSLYLWDISTGQGPECIPHGFDKRPEIPRVDSRWIATPEQDKVSILLTTRRAGFQIIWPEGRPDTTTDVTTTDLDGGDVTEDSLYDILTGRTPLPELKSSRAEPDSPEGDDTERLDDTFRLKREPAPPTQPQAGTSLEDDSEIF